MKEIPCPENENYDAHQIEAIRFIEKTLGNVFVCDEMGFGKTVTVIGWLNLKSITKVLIIPKATGIAVWQKHLESWHVLRPNVKEYHPDEPFFEAQILICHYHWFSYKECAREILKHFPYEVVIMDEAHTIRKGASSRGRHLYAKNGICRKAEKVIATTGTPLFNKVEGLYPLIKGLRPDAIDHMTKHEFGMRYCAGYQAPDGKFNFGGASNVEELAARLKPFMIRRTEDDMPSKLPVLKTPKIVYLHKTAERSELVEQLADFDGSFKIDHNVYNDDGEELATLRRLLGESKIKQAAKFILKQFKTHKKIVVFAYHRSVAKLLHEILSEYIPTIKLIGGMNKKKAARAIEEFQTAPKDTKMGAVLTFAYSDTITLTASARPIFVELSYIWNENRQAIKRVHRRGQTEEVEPVFLAFKDSFDMRLLKINYDKIKTDKAFEKGRGA